MSDFDSYPTVPYPAGHIGPHPEKTIEEAFWRFHRENPRVYDELVLLARRGVRRGVDRLGMKMLFEVLRWRHALRTGGDEFKLNNNYHSYYARFVMMREPDLVGVFETRKLHAPGGSDWSDPRNPPDDPPPSGVREPRRPSPAAGAAQLALVEPIPSPWRDRG